MRSFLYSYYQSIFVNPQPANETRFKALLFKVNFFYVAEIDVAVLFLTAFEKTDFHVIN